MYNNIEYG